MRYFFVFFLLVVSYVCSGTGWGDGAAIKVRVAGNERLDAKTVKFYAKVEQLTSLQPSEMADAVIKNLYATSLFSEVNVKNEGEDLIIIVKENPIVRDIVIKGNHAFSDKSLGNDILQLKKMSVYTEAKLNRDLNVLHSLYQGRGMLNAKVTYTLVPRERNTVDVIIRIHEGWVARIKSIRFVGNEVYKDTVLKSVLASKERKLSDIWSFFGSGSKFFAERLLIDQSMLRDFYASRGYLDFKVKSAVTEVSEDMNSVDIIFAVEEGKRYLFGTSSIDVGDKGRGEDVELESKLNDIVLYKEGDVFNIGAVNNTMSLMTAYLNEKGRLFAEVQNGYEINGDSVNVKYAVVLGESVYVRKINIVGNDRTLDPVIRKHMGITEGDIYSTYAVRQTRKRLLNLDYFESADLDTQSVSKSLVDVNFSVKERGTGTFDIGAGFSPNSGLIGKLSIKERNLLGTGKVVAFDLSRSVSGMTSVLDLITPDIFGSDVSFGVGAFYSRQGGGGSTSFAGLLPGEGPFSDTNAGFSARLSCGLTDELSATMQYYYKYHSIHSVGSGASRYIQEQAGEYIDSSVGYSLVYSDLDSAFMPKSGILVRLTQSFSGISGDLHYVKTEVSSAHVYPILSSINSDITLKIKPSFGYVFAYAGEKVRIGQRYFMGSNEVRGFSASGIGPRDIKTNEALGGKLYYGVIVQTDFPIGLPDSMGIRGSLFLDVGSLSRLDYEDKSGYVESNLPRVSVGFGFSWRSPFGPIRIDFGFPIAFEKYDIRERMRISTDTGI